MSEVVDHENVNHDRAVRFDSDELIMVLEAAQKLKENRSHAIRTTGLDAERTAMAATVNQFLSRHAFEALGALEFANLILPQILGQQAQVLASHPITYLSTVNAFNQIATTRREAAEEAAQKRAEAAEAKPGDNPDGKKE